jgi:hypothetical protein
MFDPPIGGEFNFAKGFSLLFGQSKSRRILFASGGALLS